MPVASLVVRIAADIADFEKNIAGVERTLLRTGRNLENIGSRMTKGITLPLVAAVGVAAKAAIDFESSFAGVRKTVDATETQFKQLEGEFRNLAKTMPLSVNEINKVAESAGQLGVKADNISAFTQSMIKLGTATNLTADEAAQGMARFANALGEPNINMEKLGSALVALGNAGASTEKDILSMAGRMAGAGAQIGLSAGSIFGMANALSSVGIEADKGGTAISRLFSDLNKAVSTGSEKLTVFAEVAGLSVGKFKELFKEDSAAAITKFIEGLHNQKAAGADLLAILAELGIKQTQYKDTILLAANAGPQFAESVRLGNTAFAEGRALQDEYNERLKTTESQLKLLRNNLHDVAITFGQAFLPIINQAVTAAKPLVQSLADMATAFKELPEPIRNITFGLIALVASLGPIIFVVGKVQQAFAGILGVVRFFIPAMATTGTAMATTGTAATGLGVRFTGLAGSVGRAATAIGGWPVALGATAAALVLGEKGMSALGSVVASTAKIVVSFASDTLDLLKDGLVAAGGKLVEFGQFAAKVSPEVRLLAGAINLLRDGLAKAAEGFKQVAKEASEGVWLSLANSLRSTNPLLAAFLDLLTKSNIASGRLSGSFAALEADSARMMTGMRSVMDEEERISQEFPEDFQRIGKSIDDGLTKPLKLGGEELDKAGKKLKDYQKAIKELSDELSGVKLAGDVTKLTDAFNLLTDAQKTSPAIMGRVGEAAERLRQDGAKLSPELLALSVRTEAFSDWLNKVPGQTDLWATSFRNLRTALEKPLDQLRDVNDVLLDIARQQVPIVVGIPDNVWSVIGQGREVPIPDIPAERLVNPFREAFQNLDLAGIILAALKSGSLLDGIAVVASGLAGEFTRVFAERVAEATRTGQPLSFSSKAIGVAGTGLSSLIQGFGFGEVLGKGKGALAGAGAGAAAGIPLAAVTGGLSIAVGAIAGAIGGWLGGMKKAKDQLAELREAQLAVLQEFGGFDKLKAKADEFGISLGNALTTKKPEEFTRVMERLGKAIDEQKVRIEGFGIAVEGINAKAALFAAPFEALLKDTSVDGFTAKLAEMGQRGQAEFERIGTFAAAAFAGMVKESGDAIGAINALAPSLTILQKGLNEFGLTSTGTIDSLLGMFSFINDKVSGPIFANIQATGQIFDGLTKGGLVTKEIFQTVATDIGASFRELEAKGGDVSKAMALSQPILQRLWEGQQLYGDITDDTTKSILKQAEEQGLVGANMKSVNDKILDVLIEIRDIFGKDLPKAFSATAEAAKLAAQRIEQDFERIKIRIPIEYVDTGFDPTASGKFATPLASGGIVRRPTLALIGESGPEAVIPLNQLGSVAPQGGTSTVIFEIAGQRIARATVPYLPGEIRRYVPA